VKASLASLFCLCYSVANVTLQVFITVLEYRRVWYGCPHAVGYAHGISNMLVVVSSSTNFIIYFFVRPNFRAVLRDRMMCVKSRLDDDQSFQLPTTLHVETSRSTDQNVQSTSVVDRNNRIDISPPPVAVVPFPLVSTPTRNTTTV